MLNNPYYYNELRLIELSVMERDAWNNRTSQTTNEIYDLDGNIVKIQSESVDKLPDLSYT